MYSGYLAAKSIADGTSYSVAAKKKFGNYPKASIVTRYLWEGLDKDKCERIMRRTERIKDLGNFLPKAYGFDMARRAICPLALKRMKRRYPSIAKL